MMNQHALLLNYLGILEQERKFKAKVVYTLTCIHNYLGAASNQVSALRILAQHCTLLQSLINLHSDPSILEQLTLFFSKFQTYQICPISTTSQFLNNLITLSNIEDIELTDSFVQSLGTILHSLRHEYAQTKAVCMKLIKNRKIKPRHQQTFVDIIRKYSYPTLEDCGELSQLGVQAEIVLNLMWVICKDKPSPTHRNLAQKIIDQLLSGNWHNEKFKYQSLMVAVACSTNEEGVLNPLKPAFINDFYRNNPKPLYASAGKTTTDPGNFAKVLAHFAHEFWLSSSGMTMQQWRDWVARVSCNKEQAGLLSSVVQKKQTASMIVCVKKQEVPISLIPLNNCDIINWRLVSQPTLSNCFRILYKLIESTQTAQGSFNNQIHPICLFLMQSYLTHKDQQYLRRVQSIILASTKNLTTFFSNIQSNPHYTLFLPILLVSLDDLPVSQKQAVTKYIDNYVSTEQSSISYQFYLAWACLRWKYRQGVSKFLNFLLRKLNKDRLPYEEVCFYFRNNKWEQDDVAWLQQNFEQEMESILEKIFVRLTDEDFKDPKLIVFALEKYGIFKEWSPTYRWVLNPLDEPLFSTADAALDSLEVFETVVENCTNTPFDLIKRFFAIVAKNWEYYNHEHMFTIQRIATSLLTHQFSSSDLQAINSYLKQLCKRYWPSPSPYLYECSFELLIKITLMQQTEGVQGKLKKQIRRWIASQELEKQPYKTYQNLKQSLFCLEVLSWVYQGSDELLEDAVGELVMKIINGYDRIEVTNESNKELLIQSCLKVMSQVPHNCNLLGLQLSKVLLRYTHNSRILACVVGIIRSIKEANAKAISKFKLDTVIPQLLSMMLTSTNLSLNQVCIELLQQLWEDSSPYHSSPAKNIHLLKQIIRAEIVFLTDSYRPQVVAFILPYLLQLSQSESPPSQWIRLIWFKYGQDKQVADLCFKILPDLKDQVLLQEARTINRVYLSELKKQTPTATEKEQENNCQIIDHISRTQQKTQPTQVQISHSVKEQPNTIDQVNEISSEGQPKLETTQVSQLSNKEDSKQIIDHSQLSNPGRASNAKIIKPSPRKKLLAEQEGQLANNIKGEIAYIESLAGVEVDSDQEQKLSAALDYLRDAISTHFYYCQKAVNLGLVTKCLNLTEKTQALVLQNILNLFVVMSQCKEKNLLIFNDKPSIDFFKKQLKKSLNLRQDLPQARDIIIIVKNCWSSSNEFYKEGLLSMLFEMCKLPLYLEEVLQFLTESELSYQIINQIYQRGLFSQMAGTLAIENVKLKEEDKAQICLWVKLLGKVCLNKSIRQKMFSIQVHTLTWRKLSVFEERGCVQNLAFLYSSFCYQFSKLASWAMAQRIPEYFLSQAKSSSSTIPSQFYKFYRYFSQNGAEFVVHLFRIKLHDHLIETLPILGCKLKYEGYKHFYKCLSHMFIQEYYQYFIQAELIRVLVEKYAEEHCSHILSCLQKLVEQLQNRKQLEVLEKQNLFALNSIFNSKMKDDLSYQHVLQIYITLFRKFKKFDHEHISLELVNKIIRKSIFSINMEGKKKTLQFLIEFSHVDKLYYGNANCLRLLQLLVAYDVKDDDFQLVYQYLQVEAQYSMPSRSTEQARAEDEEKYPLRFRKVVQVPCQNLLTSLFIRVEELIKQIERLTTEAKEKPKSTLRIIIKILKFFTKNEQSSSRIFEKIGSLLIKSGDTLCTYKESLDFLNELLSGTIMGSRSLALEDLMLSYLNQIASELSLSNKAVSADININLLAGVAQKCVKNNIVSSNNFNKLILDYPLLKKFASSQKNSQVSKLSEEVKKKLSSGVKVKMYKPDGSNSNLVLFFAPDLFEIHCASSIGDVVKGKWKLTLNEVVEIKKYSKEEEFKKSVFYQAEGIFTKAPDMRMCLRVAGVNNSLHICFESPEQLSEWKQYIEQARQNVREILTKIS